MVIAIGIAWGFLVLKVLRDLIFDGLLIQNVALRNGRFLVSVGSPTQASLDSLFEEISKITPLSRKCKDKVDSYKACSRFNGREYSFVRI